MKNRRNIVELKYPPENPNDIWLKDGKFYRSTSEGWVAIGSEIKYTNKESMTADKPEGGTIGIDKETGEASIYNDVAEQWSPLSGGGVTSITWKELKDKRDAGKLTPGALYRITDYNCTTTQENTKSAGHQFDIVLLALSENKLAEEGWAMMNESNIYDVTFSDGVTKKCWIYPNRDDDGYDLAVVGEELTKGYGALVIGDSFDDADLILNQEAKSAMCSQSSSGLGSIENISYNYFQNSNLSAWKVWYCLDNDKDRFAWADNTYKLNPASIICDCYRAGNKKVDGPIDYSGKQFVNGTIYYRDEENDTTIPHMGNMPVYAWTSENNITIFTESVSPNSFSYAYTYNNRGDISDISGDAGITYKTTSYVEGLPNYDFPNGRGVIYRLIDEFNNDIKYDFKNIQFKRKLTDGQYDATNGSDTWCYTLNIWYNDMCQDASIVGNTLPNSWNYISGVYDNVFGYATAYDLSIEGVNTFAFVLGNNVVLSFLQFSHYSGIYSNTIGNSFHSNTIGDNFNSNIIGNYFSNNTIGNGFVNNIIRNGFGNNTIGNDFYGNTIGNDFINKNISDHTQGKNYGNSGVELATKNDIGNIETALNNI